MVDTVGGLATTIRAPRMQRVLVHPIYIPQTVQSTDSSVEKRQYVLSFKPDSSCPPSGDTLLDRRQVRDELRKALAASNPNGADVDRKEQGGTIWKMFDGTYKAFPEYHVASTPCSYTPNLARPDVNADRLFGVYHSHPHANGDKVYGCPSASAAPGDGKAPATALPDSRRGGSDADWDFTNVPGVNVPVYAITKTGRVYRVGPGVFGNARNYSAKEWRPNGPGCYKKR